MEILADIGKIISMLFILGLYGCAWGLTVNFMKKGTVNALVFLFCEIWISLHCIAFLVFLMWSWTI